jgi:hypothetical protein
MHFQVSSELTSDRADVESYLDMLGNCIGDVSRQVELRNEFDLKAMTVHTRWARFEKSEVTVGKVRCIQVGEEIHQARVVVALLRIVLQQEAGSLAEHRYRGPELASSDQ